MNGSKAGAAPDENVIKATGYMQGAEARLRPLEIIEKEDHSFVMERIIEKVLTYLEEAGEEPKDVIDFHYNAKTPNYLFTGSKVLDDNHISFPEELSKIKETLVSNLIQEYGEEVFKNTLKAFINEFEVVNYFGLAFYLATGRIGEVYLNYLIKTTYQIEEYSKAFWYYIKSDPLNNRYLYVDTKPQIFPLDMHFNNASLIKTTSIIKYTSLYKPETYNPVQDSIISFSKVLQTDCPSYYGNFVIINSFASTHLTPYVPANNPSQKSVTNLIKHLESIILKLQAGGFVSKKRQEQYICLTSYDIISNDNIVAAAPISTLIEDIIEKRMLWLKEDQVFPMQIWYVEQ